MNFEFDIFLKKVYRRAYIMIIKISTKYENPKMHRKSDQNYPTYQYAN